MDVVFFAIFMALFAGMFAFLGYLGYKKTKTAEDYYVAGRKMGPIVIAFSYGATFISAVALIGFFRYCICFWSFHFMACISQHFCWNSHSIYFLWIQNKKNGTFT